MFRMLENGGELKFLCAWEKFTGIWHCQEGNRAHYGNLSKLAGKLRVRFIKE